MATLKVGTATFEEAGWPAGAVTCVEKRWYPQAQAATDAAREIWMDRPARVIGESAREWLVSVGHGWPMSPCPDAGARDAALRLFGIDETDPDAFRRVERWADGRVYVFCLNHGWALWGWSQAFRALVREPLTVVHLDAHADLETPALVCTETPGRFDAPVGKDQMDLGVPDSVARMVQQGFVGIGGFLAPLLHANPECDVVHIEPSDSVSRGARLSYLSPCAVAHYTLTGLQRRPAVRGGTASRQVYLRTDDLEDLARLEPRGSVLLDIDLDYFCNRFEQAESPDSLPGIERTVDRLGGILEAAPWRPRVRAITMALSPGFFPSEYWEAVPSRLEQRLREIYR